MSDNDAYDKLIATLETQISDLKQEKSNLLELVKDCFKALASKEAPMYYNDVREKEFVKTPAQMKNEEAKNMQAKFYNEYVNQVEHSDFFDSPDDLRSLLGKLDTQQIDGDDIIAKVSAAAIDPLPSLHDNEES